MFMDFQDLFWNAFLILLFVLLIIKVKSIRADNKQIRSLLKEFYVNCEIKINGIYKLSFSEKLKYGVITNSILEFYSYFIPFFRVNYFRKVEMVDATENEHTVYVELSISNGSLISCIEFDSYDF